MRTLGVAAVGILYKILEGDRFRIDDPRGLRRPLHVSRKLVGSGLLSISITHYRESGGDLMKDPQIALFHDTGSDIFIPYSYINDFSGINTRSVALVEGRLVLINGSLQEDHTCFADRWLETLAAQQSFG